MAQQIPIPMPTRYDRHAPKFDSANPRTLERYIEDIGHLFDRANIVDSQAKKVYFTSYVSIQEQDIFEGLAEFAVERSYEAFVEAVRKLYPGSSKEKKYTAADLSKLVEGRKGKKVSDIGEFSEYHREFLAVSGYLVAKGKISKAEQSRAFVRGLPDGLWQRILTRLQIIDAEHDLDDEWEFEKIIDAGRYVLHGTATRVLPTGAIADPATVTLKKEEFTAMMEGLGKTIASALTTSLTPQNQRRGNNSSPATGANAIPTPNPNPNSTSVPSFTCYYCRGPHGVARCEKAAEDVQNGLLKRNEEGRLVLSNGSAIPAFREVTGNSPCERVRNWHQQQAPASAGIVLIADSEPASALQVSVDDRLAQLELEILQLRKQREVFDGVNVPSQPRSATPAKAAEPVRSTQKQPVATQVPAVQRSTNPFAAARDANRLPKPATTAPIPISKPSSPTQD